MIAVDITEDMIFAAVRDFMLTVGPNSDFEVIQAQVNRVSMPKTALWVQLTPSGRTALSTTLELPDYQNLDASTLGFEHHVNVKVQVDTFGETSADFASALTALFRTAWGCAWFSEKNPAFAPLYINEGHQMPLTSSEQQYISRWTQELGLQVNLRLLTNQEYMDNVQPKLINVEATYPAED